MSKKKFLVNIFSNWTNFILLIGIAFFVSPIIVHKLGNEGYGVWTLIVSITGYFTVLDFGINTAIVRFVSKYRATNEIDKLRGVYSSSFLFFFSVGCCTIVITAIFAYFFKDVFEVESFTRRYLYMVFFLVGLDLSLNLLFSVLLGTMRALQEFLAVNIISISLSVLRNALNVILLLNGCSILALALVQVSTNILKFFIQHGFLRRKYDYLFFDRKSCSKEVFKTIFDYSIYSFLIAIAIKVLFYTDSIVIGSLLSVSDVTFYAIPATIVEYLEKLIWAVISVLIPIISSFEAVGDNQKNRHLYVFGTKYTLFLSLPVLIVLYTAGGDFIRLWMGADYEFRSGAVLRLLLIGYFFGLSQLLAHGILKGISMHRVLAYILCVEAVANLLLSLGLAPVYGINGVALGTAIPLVVANVIFIPWYTCRKLHIHFWEYLWKSYAPGILVFVGCTAVYVKTGVSVQNYLQLGVYSLFVVVVISIFTFLFILEEEHKTLVMEKVKPILKMG